MSKGKETLNLVVKALQSEFEITLRISEIFVGMQIARIRKEGTIFDYQKAYIEKVLNRFKISEAKSVSVPADPNVSLDTSTEGVKATQNVGIMYSNSVSKLNLTGFSDSDFAGDIVTR